MRRGVRIALWSLVFWAIWTGLAGLAMTIHGDCGAGATAAEAAACVREKGRVGVAAMAVGVVVYGLLLWRLARWFGNRTSLQRPDSS